MVHHKTILINRNIEKSDEALEIAEIALKRELITTVLNRTYYAIFYTVMALAYKYNFSTATHSKLMGWFNKKFVYEDKLFNPTLTKIYSKAFILRQESDYETMFEMNINQATEHLANGKLFIETVRKEIFKNSK